VTLSLGGVVFGLTAVLVGGLTGLCGAGSARLSLLAMRDRLSREPFLLDLAFGVAPARHCRQKGDDKECRDDDDDYECG
jgi:hypothetical protein